LLCRAHQVFVDDLNMPRVDTYGTQQPIALLKLLVDKGFLYDRGKDLTIKHVKDLTFVAAMVPGRNDVDPRFVRLFNAFSITFPPDESISMIYRTILSNFFSEGAFANGIDSNFASQITSSAMQVFNAIVEAMPPTPAKFHYIFNLRDLSRITEGVMLATPDKFTTPGQIVRLLRHELLRIFYDRLVGDTDKEFVTGKIEEVLKSSFSGEADEALSNPILFGDFLLVNEIEEAKNSGGGDLVRLYEDMKDYPTIKPVLMEVLDGYNMSNKAMNLVLFDDCLDHLVRVHRLMRLPRGNALLVGVGGSGKQSITRLAAYTSGADVFTITLTRGYNEALFREDLKTLYGMLADKPVAFFFSDAHVAEEGFLELVNNMLTAGMVPALYEESEKDGIVGNIRDEAVKKGSLDSKDSVWNYFVGKCRDNLHVVLAMSPVGRDAPRALPIVPGHGQQYCHRLVRAVARAGARLSRRCLPCRRGPAAGDAPAHCAAHGHGPPGCAHTLGALRAAAEAVQLRHAEELPRLHIQLSIRAQGGAA
jgi:dynein heavy chain